MFPRTPPVDIVYPAIGVDENATEFANFTTDEPSKYSDTRW